MNQQRQTITETRYPIDQTIPHQLVVSKILGALSCHPALRIIQHDGPRPFATPTDALADLRGSCDIAVSLDGSMKYGVVIEAKTTAHSEGGAWKIFKAVREERRNALQFERLVNAAPRWWYLIVRTDKLTAKTHEEHDRNLLDCPAILVDGKQRDHVPEDFIGPIRFGEMLQFLGDRLHISSCTPIKTPSREQLAFPIDDVPVVTMNTPLKIRFENPEKASTTTATAAPISSHAAPPISDAQQQVAPYQFDLADDPKAPEGKGADAFDYAFEKIRRVDFSLMMNDAERNICQRLDSASSTSIALGECVKELISEFKIKIKYSRPGLAGIQSLLESPSTRLCLAMHIYSFSGVDSSARSAGFVFSRKVCISPNKATGNLIAMGLYIYLGTLVG